MSKPATQPSDEAKEIVAVCKAGMVTHHLSEHPDIAIARLVDERLAPLRERADRAEAHLSRMRTGMAMLEDLRNDIEKAGKHP
jgi:hypothetical protein